MKLESLNDVWTHNASMSGDAHSIIHTHTLYRCWVITRWEIHFLLWLICIHSVYPSTFTAVLEVSSSGCGAVIFLPQFFCLWSLMGTEPTCFRLCRALVAKTSTAALMYLTYKWVGEWETKGSEHFKSQHFDGIDVRCAWFMSWYALCFICLPATWCCSCCSQAAMPGETVSKLLMRATCLQQQCLRSQLHLLNCVATTSNLSSCIFSPVGAVELGDG